MDRGEAAKIAAALDDSREDIVVSDWLGSTDFKWRNIAKRRLFDFIPPELTTRFWKPAVGGLRNRAHGRKLHND
jgi:ADP-L-glycero-D-manno-heptose 6-epimerase